MSKRLVRHSAILPLFALTFALLSFGSTYTLADDEDPPTRVGRISYIDGNSSVRHGGEKDWHDASINYPVMAGDAISTDNRSRLELQLGATQLRLDGTTEVDIRKLEDDQTEFYVDEGNVNVHLRSLPNGPVTVVLPRGKAELLRVGSYHISVDYLNGDERPPVIGVTALEGKAHVNIAGDDEVAYTGEEIVIQGDPASLAVHEGNASTFDDWALSRENRWTSDSTTHYVSEETTGYEDLDNNGRWVQDPTYGAVWFPFFVAATWAPYHDGRWEFIAPWGWTWIDNAAWGFAPYHYGRWAMIGGVWGWCPGERWHHPVYAPALVNFDGHPRDAGFGGPGVNWIPLGPHEIYEPHYHASEHYARNINANHVHNINQFTFSHNDHGGISAAPPGGGHPEHYLNEHAVPGGWHDTDHRDNDHRDSFPHGTAQHAPEPAHDRHDHEQQIQAFPFQKQRQERPVSPAVSGEQPRENDDHHFQGRDASPTVHTREYIPGLRENNPGVREVHDSPRPPSNPQPASPAPSPSHPNSNDFGGHRPTGVTPPASAGGHPHPQQETHLQPTQEGWQRNSNPPTSQGGRSVHLRH